MARLTEGERKVLNLSWQCFKEDPKVDYKKLAEVGGYKTAASATSVYLPAKKKVLSDPASLTEGERSILGKALQCFQEFPKVDYKVLAEKGGYKNPASATAVFLAAKKKFLSGVDEDTAVLAKKTKKTAKKRKAAEVDDHTIEEEAGYADAEATEEDTGKKPKKRAKKGKSKGVWSQDQELSALVVDKIDGAVWNKGDELASLVDQNAVAKKKKKVTKKAKAIEGESNTEAPLPDNTDFHENDQAPEDEDVYLSVFAFSSESPQDPQDENP